MGLGLGWFSRYQYRVIVVHDAQQRGLDRGNVRLPQGWEGENGKRLIERQE